MTIPSKTEPRGARLSDRLRARSSRFTRPDRADRALRAARPLRPGSARIGANPEQLFAAGWSASFASAIALAARKRNIPLPAEVRIDAEVGLNLGDDGYFLGSRLNVRLPGLDRCVAKDLVKEAQENCPYSKATRGNIDVTIKLV
ncbi:Ohr family peroxiredoxin [Rhodoblastus sp.]|uniref:Ohr family peroxiredoxin n=1 Tax=Rhodoblastus sp. TaxID=1962975 RepID=UPI003F94490E